MLENYIFVKEYVGCILVKEYFENIYTGQVGYFPKNTKCKKELVDDYYIDERRIQIFAVVENIV